MKEDTTTTRDIRATINALQGMLEASDKALSRKRSMRPSEKAMSSAAYRNMIRDLKAIRYLFAARNENETHFVP